MRITSEAIGADGTILGTYTCDGLNVNPPLTFSEIPDEAQSLALILDDPDAPSGTFTHWLLYDMTPTTLEVVENNMPMSGKAGTNDFGNQGYGGPCPPSGTHRYYFQLYALDTVLDVPEGANREQLDQAMAGHVVEVATTMGTYARTGQ